MRGHDDENDVGGRCIVRRIVFMPGVVGRTFVCSVYYYGGIDGVL